MVDGRAVERAAVAQEQGTTDASGPFKLRGFKGNYDVEVKRASHTCTVKATLADGGSRLDVEL
jgi:hypothetical protein